MESPTTITFCSVHLHNVAAKRCDATISLVQRLHAHMIRLNEFIEVTSTWPSTVQLLR